jgi:hypothetical protein
MRIFLPVAITAMAGVMLATVPVANANLVQNGGFEETPLTESGVIDSGDSTSITDWQNNATFTLLVFPGQGDNISGGLGGFALWGPANGVANGLTATSPAGGNYIGLDGDVDFRGTGLSQTINGLVAGQSYDLSFYFAAGQEHGAPGPTTEAVTASLGAQSFTTDTRDTPYQGFSPWELESFVFTASGASELLSFLAIGTPSGAPPISLIDGISLTSTTAAAPEPATWALMLVGIAGIGGATWLRRKAAKTAARDATA